MSALSNSPSSHTVLRAEARKSLSFGVFITDPRGRYIDLTDCTLSIVAKKRGASTADDVDNLLDPDAVAIIDRPQDGYGRFNIQAATLDHAPGEYPFVIVLRSRGYSSVLVKGTLEILENPEVASVDQTYGSDLPTTELQVLLEGRQVIHVAVGPNPPPGMNWVRDSTVELLENFDAGAVAMIPPGGHGGDLLTKLGEADHQYGWRPAGQGVGELDATGQEPGSAVVAQGDGTWAWSRVVTTDGSGVDLLPFSDGEGGVSWEPLSSWLPQPNWNATSSQPGHILNKPTIGTAAARPESYFIPSTRKVSEMTGVHIVTSIPSSGIEGHLYFVIQ